MSRSCDTIRRLCGIETEAMQVDDNPDMLELSSPSQEPYQDQKDLDISMESVASVLEEEIERMMIEALEGAEKEHQE